MIKLIYILYYNWHATYYNYFYILGIWSRKCSKRWNKLSTSRIIAKECYLVGTVLLFTFWGFIDFSYSWALFCLYDALCLYLGHLMSLWMNEHVKSIDLVMLWFVFVLVNFVKCRMQWQNIYRSEKSHKGGYQ